MKAVIYVRVSTEEQALGSSLDTQREQCIKKAKELGCTSWVVYADEGVSGEVMLRPGMMDAIDEIETKEYKYFICYDPDRFSRDLPIQLTYTSQIERHAEISFVNFQYDRTPEGTLMYQIRGSIAQFEKALIKRRTTSGKIQKAHKKQWTHWPGIYGYDYENGVVTVNDEQARIVKLMFRLGSEMGVNSVADRLGLLGIESPRAKSRVWSRTTVKRILDNESYYTGKTYIRKFNSEGVHLNKYRPEEDKVKRQLRDPSEWVEMDIPPIITEEEWKASRQRRTNARRKYDGKLTNQFLLSGLLRCHTCGKTWHGHSTMRQARRVYYYVCTWKSPGPPKGSGIERCATSFVQAQELEDVVWGYIRNWLSDDSLIDEYLIAKKPETKSDVKPEIEMLQNRLSELDEEESNLISLIRHEKNPRLRTKLEEELRKVSEELNRVEALIHELTATDEETAATSIDRTIITEIRRDYPHPDEMTPEQKYKVVHDIIKEIIVRQNGKDIDLDIYFNSR